MLALNNITKIFQQKSLLKDKSKTIMPAVSNVSLTIAEGKTLGLLGESGSGKSTLARIALRLIDATHGTIIYRGEDITYHNAPRLLAFRRDVQPVFQSASGAIDPWMRIGAIIEQPLQIMTDMPRSERQDRVEAALRAVDLPIEFMPRLPRTLSGGQKQRVGIARALVVDPKVLILDEPVSALDVSVQAQILNLLKELQETRGLSYLFIGHDLAVARFLCDEVAILRQGEIVERGDSEEVILRPKSNYTKSLVEASSL